MPAGLSEKVFIIEDNELLRIALRQVITNTEGCKVLGDIADGKFAIETILKTEPTVVVMSANCRFTEVSRVVGRLRAAELETRILVLLDSEHDFADVMHSGAQGFILRHSNPVQIQMALTHILEEGYWVSPALAQYILEGKGRVQLKAVYAKTENPLLATLTPKEKEVMQLVVRGLTNNGIAHELGLSVETVRVHMKHILKKLGARDRNEALDKLVKADSTLRPRS